MISVYVAPFDESRPITVPMYATQFYNYAKQIAPDATPEQLKNLEMFAKNIKTRHAHDMTMSESNKKDMIEDMKVQVSPKRNNEAEQERVVKLGGPKNAMDHMMAKKDIEIVELKDKVSTLEKRVADLEFEREHYVYNDIHSPEHINYVMEKLDDWQIDMYSMKYTFEAKLHQSKVEAERLRESLNERLKDARKENLELRNKNWMLTGQVQEEQMETEEQKRKHACALEKIDKLNWSIENLRAKENGSYL